MAFYKAKLKTIKTEYLVPNHS